MTKWTLEKLQQEALKYKTRGEFQKNSKGAYIFAHWHKEDLENYHRLKDEYFKIMNIDLLHIKETDWKNAPDSCAHKCLQFLGGCSDG